jgi:hypothetical protein
MSDASAPLNHLNNASPQRDKIALFRSLFAGRTDVYARRFEARDGRAGYAPACSNEWAPGLCGKPKIKCHSCSTRKLLPVTDNAVRWHLLGQDDRGKLFAMGIYPLLPDETCLFLAVDFDGESWMGDATAFMDTCRKVGAHAALERSRSGNGAHAWFFFSEPVPAMLARQMGAYLITETMRKRPSLGLASYDRLFPCQDTLPTGRLGNLIALSLQGAPRKNQNSVFVDDKFLPHPDQWAFLSRQPKISPDSLLSLVEEGRRGNRITGTRIVNMDEDIAAPWLLPPSGAIKMAVPPGPLPEQLNIVHADQLYFEKKPLTPWLHDQIIRMAAFQNPEFYRAQAMRLPTYGIPRIVACAEDFPAHIALPRGCLDEAREMLVSLGVRLAISDSRNAGEKIFLKFHGELRPGQQYAADKLMKHDIGTLAATTAFGKTVVAAWMIAQREANTLIIVHTKPLREAPAKRFCSAAWKRFLGRGASSASMPAWTFHSADSPTWRLTCHAARRELPSKLTGHST